MEVNFCPKSPTLRSDSSWILRFLASNACWSFSRFCASLAARGPASVPSTVWMPVSARPNSACDIWVGCASVELVGLAELSTCLFDNRSTETLGYVRNQQPPLGAFEASHKAF